jgi:mRNA interferase RelE/StbE
VSQIEYEIQFSPLALEMLEEIQDKRELGKLRDRINQLKLEPDKQGKALTDNLAGMRSVRAVGQRYRIVYEVEEETIVVLVIGVGRRKDGDKRDIAITGLVRYNVWKSQV